MAYLLDSDYWPSVETAVEISESGYYVFVLDGIYYNFYEYSLAGLGGLGSDLLYKIKDEIVNYLELDIIEKRRYIINEILKNKNNIIISRYLLCEDDPYWNWVYIIDFDNNELVIINGEWKICFDLYDVPENALTVIKEKYTN